MHLGRSLCHNPADRYKFRTAPLRIWQYHQDSSTPAPSPKIEDAIRHHLNVYESARNYNPVAAGLPTDLTLLTGPIEPVLARLDPILRTPIDLNDQEFKDLVRFIKDGLQIPASSLKTCVSSLPHKSPVAWSLSSSRPAPTCAILTPTTATTTTIRTKVSRGH